MRFYLLLNIAFIIMSVLYIKIEPKIKNKDRKYVIWFLLILYSILMAIRPLETADTSGYAQSFYYFQSGQKYPVNFFQKYMGYEYGYIYLIHFFKIFSNSCRLFFFFTAFLGTSLAVFGLKQMSDKIAVKDSGMYAPVFAIYIASFGFLYNGISVRAGLAMGMGIMAVNLGLSRKWFRGLILMFVALTIQRSAILFIFVFFAIKYMPALQRKTHILIWLTSGLLLFSGYGDKLFPYIAEILNVIILRFQMSAFGSYLLDVNSGIGIRTTYFWLLYGILILFLFYSKSYRKYLNVIMLGTFIVVFMHGVGSISRAYDMFYLLLVPLLGAMYNETSNLIYMKSERRIKILTIVTINSMLMLKLCFK